MPERYEINQEIKLINRILEMYIEDNDIVLDFFSGSSTTAEAVLKYE